MLLNALTIKLIWFFDESCPLHYKHIFYVYKYIFVSYTYEHLAGYLYHQWAIHIKKMTKTYPVSHTDLLLERNPIPVRARSRVCRPLLRNYLLTIVLYRVGLNSVVYMFRDEFIDSNSDMYACVTFNENIAWMSYCYASEAEEACCWEPCPTSRIRDFQ